MTEDELCHIFAEHVRGTPEFAIWLLGRTKFKEFAAHARLMHQEQKNIRPRKQWWRHWWCRIPELKKDRETDIFMVFEIVDPNLRFALHIENKMSNGKFAAGQAEAYRIRAQHMANKEEYLDYNEFETILISPLSFKARYGAACDFFDSHIAYEEIADFIPAFADV
jgi:hypothetical protein